MAQQVTRIDEFGPYTITVSGSTTTVRPGK